jgi:hypothetical protein
MVEMIKPTQGSGSLVELIKMLIVLFSNVRHGGGDSGRRLDKFA